MLYYRAVLIKVGYVQTSGEAVYTSDIGVGSGDLFAAVVGSTQALATVVSIDVSPALAVRPATISRLMAAVNSMPSLDLQLPFISSRPALQCSSFCMLNSPLLAILCHLSTLLLFRSMFQLNVLALSSLCSTVCSMFTPFHVHRLLEWWTSLGQKTSLRPAPTECFAARLMASSLQKALWSMWLSLWALW